MRIFFQLRNLSLQSWFRVILKLVITFIYNLSLDDLMTKTSLELITLVKKPSRFVFSCVVCKVMVS